MNPVMACWPLGQPPQACTKNPCMHASHSMWGRLQVKSRSSRGLSSQLCLCMRIAAPIHACMQTSPAPAVCSQGRACRQAPGCPAASVPGPPCAPAQPRAPAALLRPLTPLHCSQRQAKHVTRVEYSLCPIEHLHGMPAHMHACIYVSCYEQSLGSWMKLGCKCAAQHDA